jgi:hypothetical protein
VDGHNKQKFSYFDLNPENVLFPLYDTTILQDQIVHECRLLIRTKEKGNVNFVLQYTTFAPLDEIVSFTLLKTDNNLLLSEVVVAKNNLLIKVILL